VHTGCWWGNLKERGYLEDSGVDGKTLLNYIFKKCDGGHGLDRHGAEQGKVASSCGRGKELPGSEKGEEFVN